MKEEIIKIFYNENIKKNKKFIVERLKNEIYESIQRQKFYAIISLIICFIFMLNIVILFFFDFYRDRFVYFLPVVSLIIYEFFIELYLILNTKKINKQENPTKEWILSYLHLKINDSVDKPYLSKLRFSFIIYVIFIINLLMIFILSLIHFLILIISSFFIVILISWLTFFPKSKINENYLIVKRSMLKRRRIIKWNDILSIQIKQKIISGIGIQSSYYIHTLFYLIIDLKQIEPLKLFTYKKPIKLFLGVNRDSLIVNIIKDFLLFMVLKSS